MSIQDEASEFMRATDGVPSHPRCAECGVPMWLVAVDRVGLIERKHFECQACDCQAGDAGKWPRKPLSEISSHSK